MVNIGDLIKINNKKAIITDIQKQPTGRYLICIRYANGKTDSFLEKEKTYQLLK